MVINTSSWHVPYRLYQRPILVVKQLKNHIKFIVNVNELNSRCWRIENETEFWKCVTLFDNTSNWQVMHDMSIEKRNVLVHNRARKPSDATNRLSGPIRPSNDILSSLPPSKGASVSTQNIRSKFYISCGWLHGKWPLGFRKRWSHCSTPVLV